jgi:hypothetical protein
MEKLQRSTLRAALVILGLFAVGLTVGLVIGQPVAAAVLFVAVVVAIAFDLRRRFTKRFMVLPVVVVALAAPTVAQAGVNWGPDQLFHTHGWVNAWKTSKNPDTSTAAKSHLYVHCYWGFDNQMDACNKKAYASSLGPWTDYQGVIAKSNRVYGCTVEGRWRSRGCFVAYRQFKLRIDYPFPGFPAYNCYQWVKVWLAAAENGRTTFIRNYDWGATGAVYC